MYVMTAVLSMIQTASQGGTMDAVRRALPTNPAAIFTLALSAAAVVAVVVVGRGKGGPGSGDDE
ncbi:MAG TPA: hypothetical protein VJ997_10800 [Longimicrobiales bacterium]|nr:hypothetical protein [Longimicrobiales bacterium]